MSSPVSKVLKIVERIETGLACLYRTQVGKGDFVIFTYPESMPIAAASRAETIIRTLTGKPVLTMPENCGVAGWDRKTLESLRDKCNELLALPELPPEEVQEDV